MWSIDQPLVHNMCIRRRVLVASTSVVVVAKMCSGRMPMSRVASIERIRLIGAPTPTRRAMVRLETPESTAITRQGTAVCATSHRTWAAKTCAGTQEFMSDVRRMVAAVVGRQDWGVRDDDGTAVSDRHAWQG